jgi:hypothetical protein
MQRFLSTIVVPVGILVSFIKAANGCSLSAVIFWVSLFAAAVMRRSEDDQSPANRDRRLM